MTQDTPAVLRAALEAVRDTLRRENDKPGGPIWDTIWHTPHETLFDFIDGALAQAATSAAGGATEDERIALIELNAAATVRRRLWDVVREVRPDLAAGNIGSPATLDGLLRDALPRYVPTPYDDSPQFVEVSEGAALAAQSPDSGAGPGEAPMLSLRGANEVCRQCGATGSHWCSPPLAQQGAHHG